MLFGRTKSRHTIILRGSAQSKTKRSDSLNQIFSQKLTENFFLEINILDVRWLFDVNIANKIKVKKSDNHSQ